MRTGCHRLIDIFQRHRFHLDDQLIVARYRVRESFVLSRDAQLMQDRCFHILILSHHVTLFRGNYIVSRKQNSTNFNFCQYGFLETFDPMYRFCYTVRKDQTSLYGDAIVLSSADDKTPLTGEILALLGKVTERLEPEDAEMKVWMAQHFGNPVIIDLLQDMTFMMLRVLDAIGRLEPVNGITISEQFRIPKGTVSKITRRLVA